MRLRKTNALLRNACWLTISVGMIVAPAAKSQEIRVEPVEGKVRVTIDGNLFTEYVYANCENPYLYPVIGPHSIGMTRNFPMKKVPGESSDHPHHTSIWFAHDGLNGVDFWRSTKPGHGRVIHENLVLTKNGKIGILQASNRWEAPNGKIVCRDSRTISFRTLPGGSRAIDWEITLLADNGDVHIQDTEEGTMGIRTHPNLRLKNGDGVTTANGHAKNSEGVTGKKVWGKRAAWIDYTGTINEKTVGVALFNHSTNLRHPTWWHARPYGLFTANPFGIHDFEKKPKGTGDVTIKDGKSLTLRYRIVLHPGTPEKAGIPKLYADYVNE